MCDFSLMNTANTDGRLAKGYAASIPQIADPDQVGKPRFDKSPCPRILMFFLAPNKFWKYKKNLKIFRKEKKKIVSDLQSLKSRLRIYSREHFTSDL